MLLIYGGNGWIGKKITLILEMLKTPFLVSNIRADDIKSVEDEIKTIKPTNILCLLGRTHGTFEGEYIPTIDYLEKKGKVKENVRDNLFCPVALALLCKKYDIHLTYLGTGCIFTYTDDKKIFTEEDEPNFFGSSYSVVKGYTDRLMHMFDNVLNVRIRMPISSDNSPRNFIIKLLKYNKICSMQNSMTVLDELLPIMCDMAINKQVGTVNLTNPGTIEHSEILDMYKEIVDATFTYNLFSYEEQMKVIACDRSNNELDTTLLSSKYSVKNIKDSVRDIMESFKIRCKIVSYSSKGYEIGKGDTEYYKDFKYVYDSSNSISESVLSESERNDFDWICYIDPTRILKKSINMIADYRYSIICFYREDKSIDNKFLLINLKHPITKEFFKCLDSIENFSKLLSVQSNIEYVKFIPSPESYFINDSKILWREFCCDNLEHLKLSSLPTTFSDQINCVLVEFRKLQNVEFVVRNCMTKLQEKCNYTIVCGNDNYEYMLEISKRLENKVEIVKFDITNPSVNDYNNLLLSIKFWETLTGEYILIYHEDTCILNDNIEDFLEFDYIDAPWSNQQGNTCGFSLRKKSLTIEVLKRDEINSLKLRENCNESIHRLKLENPPEDVYFSTSLIDMGKVADFKMVCMFSQECIEMNNAFDLSILIKRLLNYCCDKKRDKEIIKENEVSVYPRIFIIGGVDGGGSLKFIQDFKTFFESKSISSLAELKSMRFNTYDILFIQHFHQSDLTYRSVCDTYLKYKCRIIISVHDFLYLSDDNKANLHSCYLKTISVNPDVRELFSYAEAVIHPSEFTYDIFKRYFPVNNFIICPHIDFTTTDTDLYIPPIIDMIINIGHLTYASECKGYEYVKFLMKKFQVYKGYTIKFHIPTYHETEFFDIANKYNIHCQLALNKWGETYCYALSKYLMIGLPILYNNIGAFVSRIPEKDWYIKVFDNENQFDNEDMEFLSKKFSDMLDYIIENAGTGKIDRYIDKSVIVPDIYNRLFDYSYKFITDPTHKNSTVMSNMNLIHKHIKPFCIYFPQFHQIKENDVNFYTGMTDMKNLIEYIKDGNVDNLDSPDPATLGINSLEEYDLTNASITDRQIDIAKSSGICGFCIYYYWFSTNTITGKNSIMEKCYDNFFRKEITGFKVFFNWANEDWTRNPALGGTADISNKYTQDYILKNFNNLCGYFKHANYYKIDGCPVFYIHHPWFITNDELALLISIFNKEAIREGFKGIHIVVNSMDKQYPSINTYAFSPNYKKAVSDDYTDYTRNPSNTIFLSFNNTVRMYKHPNPCIVKIKNSAVKHQYMSMMNVINSFMSPRTELNKIMLVNSWNEWGENMAIEPGIKNGYLYLNMLADCLTKCVRPFITEL